MSDAPRPRLNVLLGIKHRGVAQRIVVWDTDTIEIGRAPENDLVLDDDELSRNHASLRRGTADHFISDGGTANGTFVNDDRLEEARALRSKDVIRMGGVEITFIKTSKNPTTLKLPVDYASELKNFRSATRPGNLESTSLGLGEALTKDSSGFKVAALGTYSGEASASLTRDLDLELAPETSDSAAGETRSLSLTLEFDGLSADLHDTLRTLLGKELELPALRVRIKSDDLE